MRVSYRSIARAIASLVFSISTQAIAAPAISIDSRLRDQTISGSVDVVIYGGDLSSGTRIELSINGRAVGQDSSAPYIIELETQDFENGWYNMRAVARNSSGQIVAESFRAVTIANHTTNSSIPLMTTTEITPAINGSNAYFTGEGNGSPSAADRGGLVFEALDAYSGATRSDAKLLRNLRDIVTVDNHDPSAAGGFVAQMEAFYACAMAIVSKTPRIWNQISAADKAKHNLLMKGLTISSAYLTSSTNPYIATRSHGAKALRGQMDFPITGSPNFINGPHTILVASAVYFGSASVNSMLNGFDAGQMTSLRQQLNSSGLRNMYSTFLLNRSGAPTVNQIVSATKNWRSGRFGTNIYDVFGIWEGTVDYAHDKIIKAGLNNGAGVRAPDGTMRGRIASGASGLLYAGQTGMIKGFDMSDAEGLRSSAQYAFFDARPSLYGLAVLIVAGIADKDDSSMAGAIAKMNRGWADFKYKTDHGYLDYSHAGRSGPNSNWPGNPTRWGIAQNMGLFRVLKAWFEN